MVGKARNNDLRVIRSNGQIPGSWEDRSVIFVANLQSLFFGNLEGARMLDDEIRTVDSYGGRLLPVIDLIFGGGSNSLVLERRPDRALSGFFESLGLSLPSVHILSRGQFLELGSSLRHDAAFTHPLLQQLRDEPAGILDGFVTDPTIARLAATLGKRTLSTQEGSHRGNNKLLLHRHLETAGLPVPPTLLAEDSDAVGGALKSLGRDGHRHAVVKSQIGASGIGLQKAATDLPGITIPDAFFHEGPCMVQAWLEPGIGGIEAVLSPSVQIFLTERTAHLYDLTEQILDPGAGIHQGNESPPPFLTDHPELADELCRQAGISAAWLHRQGYRGAASVDFLVTRTVAGTTTAYVCEINARVTGATYPSVLARHFLPHGAWRMRNLELTRAMKGGHLLDRLRQHGDLFDPASRRGILPINFNLDSEGLVCKGQFLAVAEDVHECRRLLDTAREDLPVAWDYTHDR